MSPCRETSLAVFPESETVFEYLCCPQSQKPQTVTSPPSNAALQSVHQHREGKVSGETWVNQLRRLQDKLRPAVLLLFRFWFLIIFKEDRHIAAGTVHAAEITAKRAVTSILQRFSEWWGWVSNTEAEQQVIKIHTSCDLLFLTRQSHIMKSLITLSGQELRSNQRGRSHAANAHFRRLTEMSNVQTEKWNKTLIPEIPLFHLIMTERGEILQQTVHTLTLLFLHVIKHNVRD